MEEEPNPVKDVLYENLDKIGETTIQREISRGNSAIIIEKIVSICCPKVLSMPGQAGENFGVLATSLIHYLLTNALIPSQRKIEENNIEIDIVIPDIRSLSNTPKDSLIIFIPKITNEKEIQERLTQLNQIQPFRENIWLVLEDYENPNYKTYSLKKKTFFKLIDDVNEFLSSKNKTQFKILKL